MRVYLDNAATTPIDSEVLATMQQVLQEVYGNPSSIHTEGRKARTLIENARKSIANILGVAPAEIFFTSGGTEADNTAIVGAVTSLGVKRIITSKIEHHAVLHCATHCEKLFNTQVDYVDVLSNGHIDYNHLEELLKKDISTLVTLMHANNEIGNLLDISKVGELCKNYGAFFHSDTVQTIGHLDIKPKEVGLHFCVASAHKFNGPKGIGFLFIDSSLKINPYINGGSQEREMRGGTENLYGIIGMAKALELSIEKIEWQKNHIGSLKTYMISQIKEKFPMAKFNGDSEGQSLFTVLNVAFPPGKVQDMLHFNLDIEGISCSGGSACTSGSLVGSHVIKSIGENLDYVPVRFSFGKFNKKEDIDYALEKLVEIYK